MAKILIVDDEQSILNVLSVILKTENHDVVSVSEGEKAMELINNDEFDLMLSDIRMHPIDGMQLLKLVHDTKPHMPVIMLTAFSSMETAAEALKLGAYDYILKPFKVDELLLTIGKALEYGASQSQGGSSSAAPVSAAVECYLDNIIAESSAMREACEMMKKIAPVDTPVMIIGESGTGKDNAAAVIHKCSHRKDGPFLSLNCAEVPAPMLETALFGQVQGASEMATEDKAGLIESSNNGSLLLMEVGELPLEIQEKLVRFLQEKEIRRVGSTTGIPVNTRIISSSNKKLDKAMRDGLFREDLYHRLCVIPIEIKPLRERKEDIVPLARYILAEEAAEGTAPSFDPSACAAMESYAWPGNAKELRKGIKSALEAASGGTITKEHFPSNIASVDVAAYAGDQENDEFKGKSLKAFLTDKKAEYIKQMMEKAGGKK